MKKNIGTIGMWLFPGLTIAFQIAYYIGLRGMIPGEGMHRFTTMDGRLGDPVEQATEMQQTISCVAWGCFIIFCSDIYIP